MRLRATTAFFIAVTFSIATTAALLSPRPARGEESSLTSTDDATLKSGAQNQNFGSDSTMDINDNRDGIVKFDISSIPSGATINSADLKLVVTNINGSNTRTYSAHRVLSSWSEGTVTWNDPGSTAGTNFASSATASTSLSSTGTYTWSVTADVAAFVAGTATNNGWRMVWTSNESGTNKQIDIGTHENAGNQPKLVINYTLADATAPAAVTNLAGAAASTTSLTATWTAPGDDGSTGTATSYDLRYATSAITDGNFSSATAATGEPTPSVAGSSESTTLSGLAINTQYYLALKTADEVPNTSSISNVPSAYTLANVPAAAPFGTVTESSIVADWVGNSNPANTAYYAENQTAGTNSGWITDTNWTSSSLSSETAYTFRVKARNGAGTETAWLNLGTQSTSASTSTSSGLEPASSTTSASTSTTSTPTATTTTSVAVPAATGPTVAAPVVAAKPAAADIGAPGTTTPNTGTGETTTAVPIKPTEGDTTPPTVTFESAPEITEDDKITFTGEAQEVHGEFAGVIAGLSYSFDGGRSWHPMTIADGIGTENATFTVTTPRLPDGTYTIMVRVRDNSGNESRSETHQATVDLLPVIFGSAVLLQPSGDALPTANPVIITGMPLRLIAAFEGGVTQAQAKLGEAAVELEPDTINRRFVGTISFDQAGTYPLTLEAKDGADNTFEQEIGVVTVEPALRILDSSTSEPLAGAEVIIEKFDPEASVWRVDKTPGQEYPQTVSADGSVTLLVNYGIYRARVKADQHWNAVTNTLNITKPSALTGAIRLPRRQWYKYLIPLRTRPLPLSVENVAVTSEPHSVNQQEIAELLADDNEDIQKKLQEFVGHRVLVTTVAGWNRASREQLVVLQLLQDRVGKDVSVVPWIVQQPDSVLTGILERGGYTVTGFADRTGQDTQSLGRVLFPTHYVFDRKGNLVKSRSGFATVDELVELLRDVQ